jgi:hypothetical protein
MVMMDGWMDMWGGVFSTHADSMHVSLPNASIATLWQLELAELAEFPIIACRCNVIVHRPRTQNQTAKISLARGLTFLHNL